MNAAEQLEAVKRAVKDMPEPEWYRRLRTGDVPPLPPLPEGGWGRWWDRYGDVVWLILLAAAVDLVVNAALAPKV
jgi:hypothetical protein